MTSDITRVCDWFSPFFYTVISDLLKQYLSHHFEFHNNVHGHIKGGPGGPRSLFGPRCRLFNIGSKVGPPHALPFFSCRPKNKRNSVLRLREGRGIAF